MAKERKVEVVTEEGKKDSIDIEDYLTREEARRIYLTAEEGFSSEDGKELAKVLYRRLQEKLEDSIKPYKAQGEKIQSLELGIYVLGSLLGIEAPTAFADKKEADKEIRKLLGEYTSLLDRVGKIEERVRELENPDEGEEDKSESGSKKRGKGKTKSHDSDGLIKLKEEIGEVKEDVDDIREAFEEDGEFYNLVSSLRESLEEGGDLYNTLIEAAREAGKEAAVESMKEAREAEELAERREGERRSGGKDLRTYVKKLEGELECVKNVYRAFITAHFEGPDRERYLKLLDKNR